MNEKTLEGNGSSEPPIYDQIVDITCTTTDVWNHRPDLPHDPGEKVLVAKGAVIELRTVSNAFVEKVHTDTRATLEQLARVWRTNAEAKIWAMVDPGSNEEVGSCSIVQKGGDVGWKMGIDVYAEHQGKGYGPDAVLLMIEQARASGAPRIWLTVDTENARAKHVYERAGFQTALTRPYTGTGNEPRMEDVMEIRFEQ